MAVRDAGWIQLYCADNQQAVDTTIQAFRIAEALELPVMVCVDGFVLTHTLEPLEIPEPEQVDAFLPPYRFSRTLDPIRPLTLGTLVAPEDYTEVRYAHHQAMLRALSLIEAVDEEWQRLTGRRAGGLVSVEGPEDARVGILTLGSVFGTLADAREFLGAAVKLVHLRTFRPFPVAAVQQACRGLSDLIVLERAFSPGAGGIVGAEVRAALTELDPPPRVHNFAVGLGGRDIPLEILARLLAAIEGKPSRFAIFDVDLSRLPEEER
jgi:pyruvate ferredoxin oxidoreductase alpha subunit